MAVSTVLIGAVLLAGCSSTPDPADISMGDKLAAKRSLKEALDFWDQATYYRAVRLKWEIDGYEPNEDETRRLALRVKANLISAIRKAENATLLNPANSSGFQLLALCYFYRDDCDKAIESAERARELDNTYTAAHLINGHCAYKKARRKLKENRYDEAKGLLEKAIEEVEVWIRLNPIHKDRHKEKVNVARWAKELKDIKE